MAEHSEILFTRADKGNTTVAINIDDYTTKMEQLLSDTNTYTPVKKDPTRSLTNELRSLLMKWKNNNYITEEEYKRILKSDGVLPRAYGLPKIHKPRYPLRLIVSSVNSPLYTLAYYLHYIIHNKIHWPKSHIKNSYQLANELSSIRLEPNYKLVSLDVVSLFTNIPIEFAINSVANRWNHISSGTLIPKEEFLLGIRLILNSTFFTFNKRIYKQIFGTPMGSPLSPVIADMVLQDIEEVAIHSLPFYLPFYFRYVDDIFLAAPSEQVDHLLEIFNSLHKRLQFTIEVSTNNSLNFLDVLATISDGNIILDLYHKPTFSKRYLNYHSHHPLSQKRSIVIGMVDKILALSHPQFHEKNFLYTIQILLENGYPLTFIFSTINSRLHQKFSQKDCTISPPKTKEKYFTIPYVKSISEKFSWVTKKYNFALAFAGSRSLGRFIRAGKDRLDRLAQSDVVYRMECKDCDAVYVGQTKRQLGTRLKEHRSDIRNRPLSPSVVSCHRIEFGHEFDWENVSILDQETSYPKRRISEMLHIKCQSQAINKQSDTELLSDDYLPVLKHYWS